MCETNHCTPEHIRTEIEKMKGQDFIRIEGDESLRVWFEPMSEINQNDLGFVKVDIRKENENIHICVPRGLVQIAAQMAKARACWIN